MPALLEATNLRAGYGATEVLRGLTLRVEAGEIVALLGANGAGKTTSLLAFAGLVRRTGGDLLVLGQPDDVPTHRRVRRGLALVPADRGLFAQLTTEENLRVVSRDRAASARVLDLFPALGRLLHRRAGVLSGGEQQMLALARALLRRPRLLLVDEMTTGLSPRAVEELLPIVRSTADDDSVAVVLVEQHIHAALTIADRALVLRQGQVVHTADDPAALDDQALLADLYL